MDMKWLNTIIITHNLLGLPWKPTKNKECFGLPPMIPMQHSNIKSFCLKDKRNDGVFHSEIQFCFNKKQNKNPRNYSQTKALQYLETNL